MFYDDDYPRYISAAERREGAKKALTKLLKKERNLSPIVAYSKNIAQSFWGKAWCKHIAEYALYEHRLPRGRSYLRSGCVLDLKVFEGRMEAKVFGSSLYDVTVHISPMDAELWTKFKDSLDGEISSILDLLNGKLSKEVLHLIVDQQGGLFPHEDDLSFSCTCLDDAELCKHVAATLYGLSVRFDEDPKLFFLLRSIDPSDLITVAKSHLNSINEGPSLSSEEISSLFDIDLTP
ncbi:MAG: hypothetical protein KA436_09040 [Oligoflexales bacterium]|nr:hypothetical protein [Oligoflexales bacterium]